MARSMTLAGVRRGMLVHNANTYGLFTGGHGFHQGAERIGAPVLPVSGGFTTRQAMLLHDLGAEVLVATPSYALVIAQAVHDAEIDPARAQAPARPVRRRALDRGPARRDRTRAARASGSQFLRALRNVRSRRRDRVPRGARRAARPRGPLHRRGRRSGVRCAGRRGGRGRARLHDPAQGSDAAAPLPHRRHRLGHLRAVQLRSDDGEDPGPARPARRHDHRARRQRLPLKCRACAPHGSRGCSALPARRGTNRGDGRADRSVRARYLERGSRRACARPSSACSASSSAFACTPTFSSAGRCREAKARPCASSIGASGRRRVGYPAASKKRCGFATSIWSISPCVTPASSSAGRTCVERWR